MTADTFDIVETKISLPSNGLNLSGILRLPASNSSADLLPGIVITHPFGGVKEQTASNYARGLTERGFATLVYDAAYQGESEGEPRFLEDPFARAENIKSAVTYLANHDDVDARRVGALGICAAGGYTPYAAQTDLRIKAVATVLEERRRARYSTRCWLQPERPGSPKLAAKSLAI